MARSRFEIKSLFYITHIGSSGIIMDDVDGLASIVMSG